MLTPRTECARLFVVLRLFVLPPPLSPVVFSRELFVYLHSLFLSAATTFVDLCRLLTAGKYTRSVNALPVDWVWRRAATVAASSQRRRSNVFSFTRRPLDHHLGSYTCTCTGMLCAVAPFTIFGGLNINSLP